MNLIHQAEQVARRAHAGVYRRCGEAYIEHPRRVAEALAAAGFPDTVVAAAWLHDVVEDTDTTLADLALVFPAEVVDIVDSVTHRDGEDYLTESVPRAAAHPQGCWVKIADNDDNSSPAQLAVFSVFSRVRREQKYLDARHVLYAAAYGSAGLTVAA